MKKENIAIWLLILCVSSVAAQSNWSTPVSLGSGLFYSLEARDSTVHIAYGDGTIRYRRSTDEGVTWQSPVTLGSGTIYLDRPICVDGDNIYVVYFRNFITVSDWCCPRNLGNLYMRHSTDGGASWLPEVQLTTAQGAYRVAMIAQDGNVYLTWMDFRSGTTWDLYFRKSTDGGISWEPEVKLVAGNNSVGAERPDIVVLGNSVHLFWMSAFDNLPPCYTMPNCSEVFYKRSLDGGNTWGPDTRLNLTNNYAARPIATVIAPSTVITSWEGEDGTNQNEPYILRSTDNGTTWETVQRMRDLPGEASHQNVASGDNVVHLAWHDQRVQTNKEIYYRQSSDAGVTWGPEELVSNAPGESAVPVLGTTTNYVHVLWADDRSGGYAPWYSRRQVRPLAAFTTSNTSGCGPLNVQFTSNATGAPSSYNWQFPGGNPSTSTEENPTVVYDSSGVYSVTLTVSNANGENSIIRPVIIEVKPAPTLSLPSNLILCGEIPVSVEFEGTPGATFTWTNNNPSIGLPSAGSGDLYFITGSVNSQQTGSITVTPFLNGCDGPSQTFDITTLPVTTANFIYVIDGATITFANSSENAFAYAWDFGDGITSDEFSPAHTYTSNGTFTITLTATGACDTAQAMLVLNISAIGTREQMGLNRIRVSPNPSSEGFMLELDGKADDQLECTLLNAVGQLVHVEKIDLPAVGLRQKFDTSTLPSGVYSLSIRGNAGVLITKIIVQR